MPRTHCLVLMLSVAIVLGGCATGTGSLLSTHSRAYPDANEVPVATNFETTAQHKLQAAEHWKRAAVDAAGSLGKSMRPGTLVFVKRPCDAAGCVPTHCETAFGRIFYEELVTALVTQGYRVSVMAAPGAVTLEIDAQAIRFRRNRPQYRYAGQAVELGPGIWAARDVVTRTDSQGVAVARTFDSDTNWYRTEFASGPTPQSELIVTVSASSPERTYLARTTTIYYTSDADFANYSCVGATTGSGAPGTRRTWAIPVNGDCTSGRCMDNGTRGRP